MSDRFAKLLTDRHSNHTTMTQEQKVKALAELTNAIGDTIKDLGQIPSGHLYAMLCGKMSLSLYQNIIKVLVQAGKVKQHSSHLLEWVGEKVEKTVATA